MTNDRRSWLRPPLLVGGCFFLFAFAFGLVLFKPTALCTPCAAVKVPAKT